MAAMIVMCSPLSGRIVGAQGPRLPLIAAGIATTAGGITLARLAADTLVQLSDRELHRLRYRDRPGEPAITNHAVSGMPASRPEIAAGIASMSRQVGSALGVTAAAWLCRRQPRGARSRKLLDDYAQYAQTCWDAASGIIERAAPNPPTLIGWFGASSHVLRVPLRAFLRFPVCPPGSSAFVRRPLVSLRPAFSGLFPLAVTQFRFSFGFPPGSLSLEQSSR